MQTPDVTQTSEVSGVSKFIRVASRYWRRTQASLTR